ncbi:MAG TPA: serine/threonine-protein kinase [Rhodanobacteraceae bacterium]|nr:serine/threonine-protein kinase [Rhodanobacteraceae bacterium]
MPHDPPSLRFLFDALVDLAPEARAAFLDGNDVPSAARERLQRMLDARSTPGDVLPSVSVDALAGGLVDEDTRGALAAGTRIGAFELIDVVGEGGSSTVFRAARTADGVRQIVALKLLRRALYSPEAKRQFRRERLALAQLQHAGIARLIEGGVTESGLAYIALDFVDGVPITDYVRTRQLDLRARLALFGDVCRAVEAAHRALIVHRDLKPSNVLVTGEGQVKLLDFGIAKLLDADDETQTRLPAFTPAYAAPEQRSGAPITTATDVYALGVLLGELVTGQRPNDGSGRTPSGRVAAENAPGVLPSTPSLTRRQLRGDLDNIVLKAIAPEPERRYASAGAFADDVARWLDGRPVAAHPPATLYRARKFVARHRGGVAATALIALAIVASLGVALWQADIARRQAALAREQADRADAVRRFLVGVFQRASPDENKGQPISAHQLLEKGETEVDRSLAGAPAIEADVLGLLGDLYTQISDFARADAMVKRAFAASGAPGIPSDVRGRALIGMASLEDEEGAYADAVTHAREGIALLEAGPHGAADVAPAHTHIVHALIAQGRTAEAGSELRAFIERDRAALGEASNAVGDLYVLQGALLGSQGRYDESGRAFEAAIAAYRAAYGADNGKVAHALNELSNMLDDKGDLAGAEAALRRALAIRLDTVGPDHHDAMSVENNLLTVIEFQGRFAEALPPHQRLLERGRALGILHPQDVIAIDSSIALDQRELGRLAEAEATSRSALALCTGSLGARARTCAGPERGLALALTLEGRYDEAAAALTDAIAIKREHAAPGSPPDATWLGDLGNVLRLQHRYDEAVADLREAADAFPASAGARTSSRPIVLAALAEALLDQGNATAARPVAEEAVALARKAFSPKHASLSVPLLALARVELAEGRAGEAERLLQEALSYREPVSGPADPRTREIKVALAQSLVAAKAR